MPASYTDPVKSYSDAALTALEKEHVRNIIGLESLTELDLPVSELTAEQRKATRYDIDLWFNDVGEGTLKLQGGSDGIDLSTVRDRNDIRQRVARRFGFSVPSAGGLFRIPVTSGYYGCAEYE